MKKAIRVFSAWALLVVMVAQPAMGQQRQKMAILTPLYLDNAFSADGSYLYNGNSFPKNSIPGLEFYHGASIAIDSLNALNTSLDIYVYDSKSGTQSLEQQFNKAAGDGVSLILANCSLADLPKLTKLAQDKKILLVNANVPNDGGTVNNPYLIILNATLESQVEGLFHYIKNKYPTKKIIVAGSKGSSDAFIRSIFVTLNKANRATPLRISYVDAADTISNKQLLTLMDAANPPVIVSGSLDLKFGSDLLKKITALNKTYPGITVVGMPTWENIGLGKPEFKGVDIVYGTPFYSYGSTAARNISSYYNKLMYARPSDLVYRAYSLTYKFGQLLNKYGPQLSAHLDSKEFPAIYDYEVKPVYHNGKLDYYENKKLYFLKYNSGTLKSVE